MLGDTCFVGGIRDPDFKPYRIIIVSTGLFEIPSWQLCFATLLAKILRGVWGDLASGDAGSSDKACETNHQHLPTLILQFPKELLSRRCQPHIHNIDPKPHASTFLVCARFNFEPYGVHDSVFCVRFWPSNHFLLTCDKSVLRF